MSDDEQSTLGDANQRRSVAEEMAEQQQQASVAEFFGKNKQMLGFGSQTRSLVTAIKEAVDNSLDATEEAGILPDIYVNIEKAGDYYKVTIEDNGPGITKEQIPKVFGRLLYGSRFHTRAQSRGQQGIGISAAVLYSQRTSGKPAEIVSRSEGSDTAYYYKLIIDEENNVADIRDQNTVDWDRDHGTRITLYLDANLRARTQIHNYIRYTAVVNPHARVEFHEPKADIVFERSSDQLPPETEAIPPHPHGVELGTLISMLRSSEYETVKEFLQEEFVRVGSTGAENILDNFRNRHYGRSAEWPVSSTENASQLITDETQFDAVTGKLIGDKIDEILSDETRLTYRGFQDVVDRAVNAVEADTDGRIGVPMVETEESRWATSETDDDRATLDRWNDDVPENPLQRAVTNSVSRKDAQAVNALSETVSERLDNSRVTRSELQKLVDEVSDDVENDMDERFGRTSRKNIVDELWGVIGVEPDDYGIRNEVSRALWPACLDDRVGTLYTWLDDETTAQKSDEAVMDFAELLATEFESIGVPEELTYSELEDTIDTVSDDVESDTGVRFGSTSRTNILNRMWSEMQTTKHTIPPLEDIKSDRDACQMLLEGMREANIISPPTDCLSPIGEDQLSTGLKTVFDEAEFYTTHTRDADVHRGDPFIVEAGIAYGRGIFKDEDGDDNRSELLRFANRVPLVYQRGACSTTDVVKAIDWRNYFKGGTQLSQSGGRGLPHGPLVILIHVASTSVPFTSESKDAIANVEVIEEEVERAIRECGRDLRGHLKEKRSRRETRKKRNVLGKILPDMGRKLSEMTGRPEPEISESVSRIMNNIFVERIADDGDVSITVENHNNSGSQTFTVVDRVSTKPSSVGDAEVKQVEDGDGYVVEWSVDVSAGDSASLTYESDDVDGEVDVEGIVPEEVTIASENKS